MSSLRDDDERDFFFDERTFLGESKKKIGGKMVSTVLLLY